MSAAVAESASAHPGPCRSRHRAPELVHQLLIGLDCDDVVALARQVQRHAPRTRPDLEHRAVGRARQLLPERQVAAYAPNSTSCQIAVSGIVRSAALTPSTPAPGRAGSAACAARAGPCRWAGRRAARARRATASSSDLSIPSRTSIADSGQPAYLRRRAISGARVPVQTARRTPPASSSKSASQIQETSRPSAMRSFSASQRSMPAAAPSLSSASVRSTSFAPAGFLISRIETGLPVHLDRLDAAEDGGHPLEPGADQLQGDAGAQRRRDRRERVVDVVEAGEGELQLQLALRGADAQRGPRHAAQLDLGGGDVGRRAVRLAARALVVAEVTDERPLVGVGGAAAAAVLRVVGVLEPGEGLARVLDAEVGDARSPAQLPVAAEVGDQRVVRAEREPDPAGGAELLDQHGPLVGQALQLAVAVELVAEEVGEHQQTGPQLRGHAGQPGLVDLEQPLAAASGRAARSRPPSACSTRPGCGPARARPPSGSRRSSRPSSSCRWWS